METMADVDFKGLNPYAVQMAIDTYLWERSRRNSEREQVLKSREAQGKRTKVRNALKRAGLAVKTQNDGWRSSGWRLDSYPQYSTYEITSGRDLVSQERDIRAIRAKGELDVKSVLKVSRNGAITIRHYVKLAEVN